MILELDPFQKAIKQGCKDGFALGYKWLMVQAPTRSGKTPIFCDLANDFLNGVLFDNHNGLKSDVLILVHDQKILKQIKKTLYSWHMVVAEEITSKTKTITKSSLFGEVRVFIAMAETINNRLRLPSFYLEMKNIGFIISDEAHLGNFKKIYKHELFIDTHRVGFTATPISADKKDHLYPTYFEHLVLGPSVKELIEYNKINPKRGVVPCITYVLSGNLDRNQIEDIDDEEEVGEHLSGRMQVKNTVNAIITKAFGKKLLCFNSSKEHSKTVTAALMVANLPARHMDSDSSDDWKADCLAWFHRTNGAILCNVGMTTTGFDEPSCEGTVINRLTRSLSLIKQMEARGGTPYQYPNGGYKTYHIVLDMCDNTITGGHGEWSDDVDWKTLFYHPKYSVLGVAPKKECKQCGAVNSASARICVVCDHHFDISVPKEDLIEKSMRLISKDVDVAHTIELFADRKEYASMFDLLRQTAFIARKRLDFDENYVLEEDEFEEIFLEAQNLIKEWRQLKGKKSIEVPYESIRSAMQEKLEIYGFICNFKQQGEGIFVTSKKNKL